jgi:MFS family permease
MLRPFQALAYREFRLLWIGQFCQTSAGFAERVTRSWLALTMTGSAFQLGALELTRGLTSLVLGMWGGVLADRVDKRLLLMIIQAWQLACYVVLAALVLAGRLELWHLYASAVALSLADAVNQPVRTAFVPSLVPEPLLINALSLNSIATNATRMGAPITAAALIQVTGNGGWGFVVCALLYLLVMFTTNQMRVTESRSRQHGSMMGSLLGGWAFIAGERAVLTQLIIGFGPLTIGFTYQAMLVAYVKDTLGQEAAAYGALYSFAGLGALVGGLMVASLGPRARGGRMLLITGILNGVAMLGLGALGFLHQSWLLFWAAVPFLMLAGGSQTSFRAANNGLLLRATPSELRGRVMSLDGVFRSAGTLIAPGVGLLADVTTSAVAMAVIGLGSLLVVAAVFAWQPRLRNL